MEGACIVATTVVGPVYRPVDASMVYRGLRTIAAESNLICEEITNMVTLESMTLDIIRDQIALGCYLDELVLKLLSLWFRSLTWGCKHSRSSLFSSLSYKVKNLLLKAGFYDQAEEGFPSELEDCFVKDTDSPLYTITSKDREDREEMEDAMEELLEELTSQIGTHDVVYIPTKDQKNQKPK